MSSSRLAVCVGACVVVLTGHALAGGSGLNVAVVVNEASSNSVRLGNYYCEKRGVPPRNLIRINWTGSDVAWSQAEFNARLRDPLNNSIHQRGLSPQIDFVLLSMDIPYRVWSSTGTNSTTSALFYGFQNDSNDVRPKSCSLPGGSLNTYAGSEAPFHEVKSTRRLTLMLTHSNLAEAMRLIDRAVAADGTFPTNRVLLAKSTDVARNIRYTAFDNTVFDARVAGQPLMDREDANTPFGRIDLLGYQNGLHQFGLKPDAFVPGAMADSLTSFGGNIFEPNDHTTILRFLWAGASASYGTVVEPCAYTEKFPSPQNFFYQGRGFSIAESYYLSLTNPYQGVLVGEPLAAPFARPATGRWIGLPDKALLTGTTNLSLVLEASDPHRPIQKVDLFIDGTWSRTVTNIPPRPGNLLHLDINDHAITYQVPGGASLSSVASGLTSRLNQSDHKSATGVEAFAHGDRIELRSIAEGRMGNDVRITTSNSIGSATALTTHLRAGNPAFVNSIATGTRHYVVTNTPSAGDFLRLNLTMINGSAVTVAVTNLAGGSNGDLVRRLVAAVNDHPALTGADGVAAEDFIEEAVFNPDRRDSSFNLRARQSGWDAALMDVTLTGSSSLKIQPTGMHHLDENLADLQPRNHLYVTAGVTNLSLTFPLNTKDLSSGHHKLTAVVYEGSHVRTQARIPVNVVVSNSTWSGELRVLSGGDRTALEGTLQFEVTADPSWWPVTVELRSTGYSTNTTLMGRTQPDVKVLSIPAAQLGVGLHPFSAVFQRAFRLTPFQTETLWFRVVDEEPPFNITAEMDPPQLSWPATAGRSYDVMQATNAAGPFSVVDTLIPTNSFASWPATNSGSECYYRVRVTP